MATFLGIFLGTVVGIIAGAFLQYGTQRLLFRWQRRGLANAVKRELEYDVIVIDGLIQEVGRLRGAVAARTLPTYFGYFKLTNVFFVMGNRALSEGLLYEALARDKLLELNKAATFFSASSENWVAAQIERHKQGQGDAQTGAMNFANYLDQQMNEHRNNLRDIARAILA